MKQTSFFNVGLDFRMAQHTGIGTYLRGLAAGIEKNDLLGPTELAYFGKKSFPNYQSAQIYFDAPIYSLSEQLRYRQFTERCRLWHAPQYNIPFSKGKSKLIVTVHDLIHWVYRKSLRPTQRLYAEVMLRRAVSHADHIITVSENSKQDLVRFLNVHPDKVSVVYNGIDNDFYPAESDALVYAKSQLEQKYHIRDSFFLYVGMLKEHKNVVRLMRVFLDLKKKKQLNSRLVVIGQGVSDSPEIRFLRDSGEEIFYFHKIDFGDLKLFYQRATALIHPSLYEGFGLTVLEAMACATPVLTTRRTSLPEVVGDAALLMDGEDDLEMGEKMKQLDQDSDLRSKLSAAGPLRACRFSWDKAARETVAIYRRELAR